MDPLTILIIAPLFMLLNGGVLGLVHRDLPAAIRPAAVSWRIGTLLFAGASFLFAAQQFLPAWFGLPLANGLVVVGITIYWRGLRQFFGHTDSWWMLVPLAFAIALNAVFTIFWPHFVARAVCASAATGFMFLCCARELYRDKLYSKAISLRVLLVLFCMLAVFMLVRIAVLLSPFNVATSSIDGRSLITSVTVGLAAILPVIGTTAFLLLCSERIRRDWERAASVDALTGLANRRVIIEEGARRLAASQRGSQTLAVALIDIDHFKSVNDRFGHEVGDHALQHVAAQLQGAIRQSEFAGRQGGEEFIALLRIKDDADAITAAERLRVAVQAIPFTPANRLTGVADFGPFTLTVSIGLAVRTDADHQFDDLLRRADHALYASKTAGRNRVTLA
jgi:diguanylate cyclase (GGDEF)-like protein